MPNDIPVNYPDPGFWTKTSLIQLGYGVWVNSSVVLIGLTFGFSPIVISQLNSSQSTIKVTISEESWIASVVTLVSPVGCVLCGYLMDKFGRRKLLIYSQLPVCVGWLYTGFSASARHIIIGRVIIALGLGMIMGGPRAYMTEVSLPNMRGLIGTFPNIAISIGITVQATLGTMFQWRVLCHISCAYTLILFLLNFRLPETPHYLLQKASPQNAKEALQKFRSKTHNVDAEMEELIDFKNENDIRRLSFKEQFHLLMRRSSCKPFWIMVVYIIISQLSGASIIIMWTIDLLQRSNSSVKAETGNAILGVTRIVMGLFAAFLIFHIRRRILAIVSAFINSMYLKGVTVEFLVGSSLQNLPSEPAVALLKRTQQTRNLKAFGAGTIYITLALLTQYLEQSTVLPQLCYMGYIVFVTIGYYNLPPIIMYELYPLQVRGILGGISTGFISFLMFATNKGYPYVRDGIGFVNTLYAFSAFSLAGCIFLYFFLPETKDLTLQEIEEYFNERRPTLISQRELSMQAVNKDATTSR